MPSSTNMHLVAPRTWQIVNNIMVVYADPEKVLSTTSSGSISWVARFYLVGGEGIQTSNYRFSDSNSWGRIFANFSKTWFQPWVRNYIIYISPADARISTCKELASCLFSFGLHSILPTPENPLLHHMQSISPPKNRLRTKIKTMTIQQHCPILTSLFCGVRDQKKHFLQKYISVVDWIYIFDPKYVFLIRQQGIEML